MKVLRFFVVVGCLVVSVSASAIDGDNLSKGNSLLRLLAYQLRNAHMAPQGPDHNFICPKEPGRLNGLERVAVEAALGKADFSNSSHNTSTYYFSSTPPSTWHSHYPRLTLYYGSKQLVTRATCYDFGYH